MPNFLTLRIPSIAARGAIALACAIPAYASAQQAPVPPPPVIEKAGRGPEMTLQANAWTEVKQDTVTLSVAIDVSGNDQASVSQQLNKAMDAAMKEAKSNKDVAARSGAYRVWANTNNKGKPSGWQGQGEIVLESRKFDVASAVANKLGDKSSISNVRFSLSREGREEQERKLLNQAAAAFRERAVAASSAFGFSGYRIAKIELGGSGGEEAPRFAMMAKAQSADGAPNVDAPLEPGTITVTVNVSGTIVLQ